MTIFALAHFAAMCFVGGAVLERYLMPLLPITLAAFANALCALMPVWRNAAFAAMCTASAGCIWINPIYPFPLENNLAWIDFVDVQHDAAQYLSSHLPPDAVIAANFPFSNCMRRSELGYTAQHFNVQDVTDYTRTTLAPLRGQHLDAFAIFSSTWDPLGLNQNPRWVSFLEKFYAFEPDVPTDQIPSLLGLRRVARFERHGQWIELYQP